MSDNRWALVRGAHRTWTAFRRSWNDLPRGAWKRWLTMVLLGLAASALVTYAVTRAGQYLAPRGLQAWDTVWLLRIEERSFFTFQSSIWWQTLGTSALLIPLVVTAAVLAALRARPLLSLTFLAAYLLQKPLVFLGWSVWNRARPTLIEGGVAAPPLQAYPSGHTVQAVTVYGPLIYLWIRASDSWIERLLALLLWGALVGAVGLARLRLGTHWPSDEIAAVIIGLALLSTLILALRRAEAPRE
jgi:membrane-associated phospholipid phosphatase